MYNFNAINEFIYPTLFLIIIDIIFSGCTRLTWENHLKVIRHRFPNVTPREVHFINRVPCCNGFFYLNNKPRLT